MATLVVEISGDLEARLEREFATGRYKDRNSLVQALLDAATRKSWREATDEQLAQALDEIDSGDVTPWNPGDALKLGVEYLQQRRSP